MRIEAVLLSPKVLLISLTTSWALDPPMANARTSWINSSLVTWFEKWMLARPAVVSSCAKLRSACPVSSGIPSSSSLFSETPSRNDPSAPWGRPSCSSFQVTYELAFGAFVVEAIEADILHQYVQTVDKRPGGRDPGAFACVCRWDTRLLLMSCRTG